MDEDIQNQFIEKTLNHNSEGREYLLYVPASYDADNLHPLMLNFHGYSGTMQVQSESSDMRDLAERDGCLLIYPQGLELDGDYSNHWNTSLPGGDNKSSSDDFGFIEELINTTSTEYSIDISRVYACGYSNGAFLSYALASFKPNLIAGIGSVAGTMLDDAKQNIETNIESETPPTILPMINVHGLLDDTVSYEAEKGDYPPVSDVIDAYAQWIGASESPTTSIDGDITKYVYTNESGFNIEHYVKESGGHAWDDTWMFEQETTSELIWNYLIGQSYLGEQTQEEPVVEEPVEEEEPVVEEPVVEEPPVEEPVVEEPPVEEPVVEEPVEEEEPVVEEPVVEEPVVGEVNCCTDDHISSMVTTDSELGGANIQQKNGIGGKSSIPGKLCWNEVVISDYTLPVSYDCPFEFEGEMWENGGITLDLRFNVVVDLELIFVASNGVCYETTIISGETGPFIFTKTGNSEAPFNPDEILEEKNDEPTDEQPVNDTTDDTVTEHCECAVAFDGQTGSYVNVPYRENPSTLTVVCHFKVDSHDNVNVGVDDKKTQYLIFQQNTRTSGNTGAYYVKYTETTSTRGTLTIGMSSEEGVVVEASTPVSHIRVFQTYMLHAVFGSTSLKLYLDGEIISTETTNFDINYHSEHTLHLGRKRAMGDNTDNFFAGKMFSFYVYAKELSADYIKAFFNTHKCEQIPFPTPTPSNTPTETTTPSPVPSPTSTYTPTHTLTHTPSSTETPTSTHTPTWTTTVLPPPALIGTTPDKQYYDNTMRILEYENEIHKRTHNLNPGDKIDASEFGIEGSDATFPRYAHSMYLHLQGISVDKETAYIKGESNSKYQYTFAPYGYKNKTEEGTWKDITSEYVKLDSSVIRDADATTDRVNGCNVLFFRIKDENRKMDTEDCIGPISNSTNNNIVFDKENFNIKITKNNGQDFVFTETLSSRVLPPRDGELIMTVKGKDQIKTCYPITGGHPNYYIQPANGAGGPVGLEYRFKQNDGWGNWNPVSIPGQENPVIGADNGEEWQFRVFGGTHGITTGVGERNLRLVEMKIKGMAYLTTIKNIGRETGKYETIPDVGNKWTTLKKLDFSEFDMRSMTTFTSIGSSQKNLTEVLTGPKNDTKCITGNFSNFMYNTDSFTNCDLSNWCLINADYVADFSDPERPDLKLPKTEDC